MTDPDITTLLIEKKAGYGLLKPALLKTLAQIRKLPERKKS